MEYAMTMVPNYSYSKYNNSTSQSDSYNAGDNYSSLPKSSSWWVGPPGCTCNGGLCRKTCGGVRAAH